MSEQSDNRQHFAVALLSLWLICTSPWIAMLRRIPAGAGWLDYPHVTLGFVTLLLAITYTWSCTRAGRWQLYFPWAPARIGAVGREFAGLLRGRVPAAEGGGLFGFIEGLLLITLALTAASSTAFAQATQWKFDPSHSEAAFGIRHFFTTVAGRFNTMSGSISFDEKDRSKSRVEATIDANSVFTNNEKRDGHLRSEDFFDVAKKPTITFKSTKVVPGEGNDFTIGGADHAIALEQGVGTKSPW